MTLHGPVLVINMALPVTLLALHTLYRKLNFVVLCDIRHHGLYAAWYTNYTY